VGQLTSGTFNDEEIRALAPEEGLDPETLILMRDMRGLIPPGDGASPQEIKDFEAQKKAIDARIDRFAPSQPELVNPFKETLGVINVGTTEEQKNSAVGGLNNFTRSDGLGAAIAAGGIGRKLGGRAPRRDPAGTVKSKGTSGGQQTSPAKTSIKTNAISEKTVGGSKPATPNTLRSRIEEIPFANRQAKGISEQAAREIQSLKRQFANGNESPGIGSNQIRNKYFELRGRRGGRVIVKQTGEDRWDIVGEFQGHKRGDAANSKIINRLIDEYEKLQKGPSK